MNKETFLESLRKALTGLPAEEIDKTTEYYSEMIDDAIEEGESEETVTARLGNIEDIAEKIINETPIRTPVKADLKKRRMSTWEIVLIAATSPVWVSLLAAFISVIASLYISIWSIAAALFAVSFSCGAAAAAAVAAVPFLIGKGEPIRAMYAFGIVLAGAGMAVLMFYAVLWLSKMIIKLTLYIIRKIKSLIIKKGGDLYENK